MNVPGVESLIARGGIFAFPPLAFGYMYYVTTASPYFVMLALAAALFTVHLAVRDHEVRAAREQGHTTGRQVYDQLARSRPAMLTGAPGFLLYGLSMWNLIVDFQGHVEGALVLLLGCCIGVYGLADMILSRRDLGASAASVVKSLRQSRRQDSGA